MNEHGLEQFKSTEEKERTLETEIAGKIRNFVDDPRLKFHYTTISRMAGVLEKGALSYKLAKRAGVEVREYMSVRGGGAATEDRSVSIVDREKNPGDDEKDDWWIKLFSSGNNHVGFLLSDDIKLRKDTPQPNESLVPIRIRPDEFEGIFITERAELYETVESRRNESERKNPEGHPQGHNYGVYLLSNFFDYEIDKIKAIDEEIPKLDKKIGGLYRKNNLWGKINRKEWPEDIRQEMGALEQEQADRMERVALMELERILGKSAGEITEKDLFVFFAKEYKFPLYCVSKDFKSQRVIWPEIPRKTSE